MPDFKEKATIIGFFEAYTRSEPGKTTKVGSQGP
jgi:hypothetical protein